MSRPGLHQYCSGCEALVIRVIVVRPIVARETNVRGLGCIHVRVSCLSAVISGLPFHVSAGPLRLVLVAPETRQVVGRKILHDNEKFSSWRWSARRDRIPTQAKMRQCGIVRVAGRAICKSRSVNKSLCFDPGNHARSTLAPALALASPAVRPLHRPAGSVFSITSH